jgi:hypothetical protein
MPVYRESGGSIIYDVVKVQTCSGQPLEVTTTSGQVVSFTTAGTPAGDAFGRARVSNPLTLFDSSHRYSDNGLWATATGVGSDATFNANAGLVELNVPTTSGGYVKRETKKVFAYQPGKSLLVLSTFTLSPAKTNLRQRVGYFNDDNGLYIQLNNSTLSFVERNSVTGTLEETVIHQADWNVDKLDGTGPSGLTLDITKAQIFWMDIEWLGLGTVRLGFVIKGLFVHCHSFHHANIITSTYITTACLPLRYEIENLGTTTSSSTLKQVCSTVISEGGYELRGRQTHIALAVASPRDLTNAPTFYPVVSTRLKSTRLNAIVILSALSVLGIDNNSNYSWQLVKGGTTSGGTWVSAGTDSSVEYNISGSSFTIGSGNILAGGFAAGASNGANTIDVDKEQLFRFQLERDGFTNTPFELTLIVATENNGSDVLGSIDIEEITL